MKDYGKLEIILERMCINNFYRQKWLDCKQKWDAIEVLKLFLEHVLLKHNFKESVGYLNRLSFVS